MRSSFKFYLVLLGLGVLWVSLGCQTQVTPVGAYSAPATTANYSLVCNFQSAVTGSLTDTTNSNLFEVGTPNNTVSAPGAWSIVNNFTANEGATMMVELGGANGTSQAAHITGHVDDNGDGIYPSIGFSGFLDTASGASHNAYNMSFFTGVKFYVNFTPADTTPSRFFYIPTTQEEKPPQGDCTAASGCYNYFGYTFPAGSTGGWKSYSFDFTSLVTSYGVKPVPPTFTGVNLQQVTRLLFQVGRQNVAGHSEVDFWVDEIYFY